MRDFFRELGKRRVIRVAVAYLIVAWLVLQVADVVLPALGLPDWTITLTLALLAAGFPAALVLSWIFDIGPEGLERTQATRPDTGDRSIAVLPFPDLSAEQDQSYFCDGLTDELIGRLARVPGLRVASRSSSFAFKNRNDDLAATAEKLRVAHIVEGGVRKDGNRVRISAQLTDVANDHVLWAENYDHELSDIFAIQQDLAENIQQALQLQLGAVDPAAPAVANPKAYEYYLKGRGYAVSKGQQESQQAQFMFAKATEADPGFKDAWIWLAHISALRAMFYGGGDEARRISDEAGKRALELAPEEGAGYMARAFGQLACQCYEDARSLFLKAVELDPHLHEAWHYLGRTAHNMGEPDQEVEYYKRAVEVNPEDWESSILLLSPMRQLAGKEEVKHMARKAVERVEKHLEDYPDNQRAYYLGIGALILLDEIDKARKWAESAYQLAPDDSSTRYNLACFYSLLGEIDKALDMLENSITSRTWIENDSDMDNLRDHPRYQRYIESLPEGT